MTFLDNIKRHWQNGTQLCVGLDPFPEFIPDAASSLLEFNQHIIDATKDLVCAFKPQFAHFAALGREDALKASIRYIKETAADVPVILDSKRGDIGSTADMYAKEAFIHYGADAVTVNPYMGSDTVLPFVEYGEKGVIILCRTSNPSASEFQNLMVDGEPLYLKVARKAQREWNVNNNVCLVVGATATDEMAKIRDVAPDLPFLVPGIGSQGGDVAATVNAGKFQHGGGLIINASRSVLYASKSQDYAAAARIEAMRLRDQIQALI